MFDDDQLYPTTHPSLASIAPRSTMAHWRSEGKGPPFIKFGKRVLYRGADLNAWLQRLTIHPTQEAASAT